MATWPNDRPLTMAFSVKRTIGLAWTVACAVARVLWPLWLPAAACRGGQVLREPIWPCVAEGGLGRPWVILASLPQVYYSHSGAVGVWQPHWESDHNAHDIIMIDDNRRAVLVMMPEPGLTHTHVDPLLCSSAGRCCL